MVNLADSRLPQRKVALGKKDNFLNFVSMIQNRHDASVSMFFNRFNQYLVLRTYVYKNPFLKQNFSDAKNWVKKVDKTFPLK